ncbi:GNAT family N-acetyltransferase [Oceanirhabdus sp. W0125-5]|uniref:GNAT family N-acetyltransferase n=1 Tax=Oceanirhabdus sp. W0125-5 TaxID=2999116 RepID=UPI0022F30F3C|nr:GNAT family protein [Oceanirhabdus sp. W0125-5]WBW97337.1 GNAT family protein [Oceanirhabdus sp. W0125-5]
MRYFKKLEGERLYLSPINVEDYEIYTKWMNDLNVTINLGNFAKNFSKSKEKESVERLANEESNFAIVLKEGDKLIGNCSLFSINNIHRRADLGIFIGEEEHRGNGYGVEAIELILSHGFRVLGLNNVILRVFSFNERAIRAYEKIGFKEIGRRREAFYINNKYYDVIYMDIIQREYKCKYLDDILPR